MLANKKLRTVVNQVSDVEELLKQVGTLYNLKTHRVSKTSVDGPGDLRVHLGEDGRFYVVNTCTCILLLQSDSIILTSIQSTPSSTCYSNEWTSSSWWCLVSPFETRIHEIQKLSGAVC